MPAQRRPDIAEASIVLVGKFNPAIFQPMWFAVQNLLPREEALNAEVKVVHPEVSDFNTDSVHIQVTSDRFMAMTKASSPWLPLTDLVAGTFGVLEHTPVTAMGLNRHMHFAVASEEEWHRIGDTLVPKEGWNAVLGGRPGLGALMILAERQDKAGVPLRVELQPSRRLPKDVFGVFIQTNEHYTATQDAEQARDRESGLKELLRVLYDGWESSQNHAEQVAASIIDWAVK